MSQIVVGQALSAVRPLHAYSAYKVISTGQVEKDIARLYSIKTWQEHVHYSQRHIVECGMVSS